MATIDIATGDGAVRATVTGAGPTVVLLHAGGERREVWTPVAAELAAAGLRTVAVDQRGHGESTGQATALRGFAEDVTAIVRHEQAPVVLVGASLGGFAAIAALADPATAERVAGLVLVDVVPDPDPARVRAWLGERGLLDRHPGLVDDILGSGSELLAAATAIEQPVLLVHAGRSPLPDADIERFRTAGGRVTVVRVPGSGHLVARDAPVELARVLTAHATVWLGTDDVVERAFALQRALGAEAIEHPGGTLYAHLRRVHAATADRGAAPRVRLAAICHATYGTDGFRHALLPLADRQRLGDVIGTDAEGLVHLYGSCDRGRTYPGLGRRPLPVFDRFTGGERMIDGIELRDFAVLSIANELDVARHARLTAPALDTIHGLVAALAAYVPTG